MHWSKTAVMSEDSRVDLGTKTVSVPFFSGKVKDCKLFVWSLCRETKVFMKLHWDVEDIQVHRPYINGGS